MLTKPQKAVVKHASPEAIQAGFASLGRYFDRGRWIQVTNRYRARTIAAIRRDLGQNPQTIDDKHLSQYIAASVVLHYSGGWSYLGRAIQSHSRGDRDSARHLAYYAELRATMAILASQGIGIFNTSHFVVDKSSRCRKFSGRDFGTHKATWQVLKYWAGRRTAVDLLGEIIRPGGIPFSDWITAFDGAYSAKPIARHWLLHWGLDIGRLSADRDSRNEASYRPSDMISAPLDVDLAHYQFLTDAWRLFEPSTGSRFDAIDRHILRRSLELSFFARNDKTAQQLSSQFKAQVDAMLAIVSPTGLPTSVWEQFLTRTMVPDDPRLLRLASSTSGVGGAEHHMEVMARAALLLRLASGASALLLQQAGINSSQLGFWWKGFGLERGLWQTGGEPVDSIDLWSDVEAAVQDLETWVTGLGSVSGSLADCVAQQAHSLVLLGECERIAVWGIER